VLALQAQSPSPPPSLSLAGVLSRHLAAVHALGASGAPKTLETSGTLAGLGETGTFHYWRDGHSERDDETLGVRTQRTLRTGDREEVRNANGDVRIIRGVLAQRQITEDFIDSGDFARHPEDDVLLGPGRTLDGRPIWRLRVTPPGGASYGVGIDAANWMVDEKAYPDGDGLTVVDYDRYRNVDGALVPFLERDSNGDRAFDVTSQVVTARAGVPIDPAIFAPLVSAVIDAPAPLTVPLLSWQGHLFVRGSADGQPLTLLLDSGSQSIFLDKAAAQRLGLSVQGSLEIRGAERTQGGVAALDAIAIGGASVPVGVASVVDLTSITYDGKTVDGVLGYPFFACAEVRIDPEKMTMTMARPGSLPPLGSPIAVDTDRELPEVDASINRVRARVLVDTGDTNELLVFEAFTQAHPGLIPYARNPRFVQNSGVGGSNTSIPAMVDQLGIGPFMLYNRYADIILASKGAFADSEDAGNVGWASLKNFVVTFDLANATLSLEKTRWFDEGRGRSP